MRKIRTYHEVDHGTGSNLLEQVLEQRQRLADRLSQIGAVVAVASGKGGVGKSAITSNLSVALAARGYRVGALDADLNGPSLGRMLAVSEARLGDAAHGIVPATGLAGVRVVSMDLLQEGDDAPLRWKDPGGDTHLWQSSLETSALREFLADVAWGRLDILLVDVPPGVDKIRRLMELVPSLHGMVVVTTPGEAARGVVSRSLRMVKEEGIPAVGLVANMSSYACPGCHEVHALFPGEAPVELSRRFEVPIWADLPFDPRLGEATDRGRSVILDAPDWEISRRFGALATRLSKALGVELPAPEVRS
ncbi:MAG: P-loop NTPase [Gemmatimonadota bacterium]